MTFFFYWTQVQFLSGTSEVFLVHEIGSEVYGTTTIHHILIMEVLLVLYSGSIKQCSNGFFIFGFCQFRFCRMFVINNVGHLYKDNHFCHFFEESIMYHCSAVECLILLSVTPSPAKLVNTYLRGCVMVLKNPSCIIVLQLNVSFSFQLHHHPQN